MPYTEDQKAIAKALLRQAKSARELAAELQIAQEDAEEALSGMLERGVARKDEGKPPKYALTGAVVQGVKRRMAGKSEKPFRVKMIIEGLSESEEALKKQMDMMESRLRKEPYDITGFKRSEVTNAEKNFTMFFDLEVAVPSLKDVTFLIVNYGPSYIELLEPHKITLSLAEAQDMLSELVNAVHYYVGLMAQLRQAQMAQAGAAGAQTSK